MKVCFLSRNGDLLQPFSIIVEINKAKLLPVIRTVSYNFSIAYNLDIFLNNPILTRIGYE